MPQPSKGATATWKGSLKSLTFSTVRFFMSVEDHWYVLVPASHWRILVCSSAVLVTPGKRSSRMYSLPTIETGGVSMYTLVPMSTGKFCRNDCPATFLLRWTVPLVRYRA